MIDASSCIALSRNHNASANICAPTRPSPKKFSRIEMSMVVIRFQIAENNSCALANKLSLCASHMDFMLSRASCQAFFRGLTIASISGVTCSWLHIEPGSIPIVEPAPEPPDLDCTTSSSSNPARNAFCALEPCFKEFA